MDTSYYVDTSYGYNAASASGLVGGMLIFMIIVWIIAMAASVLMAISMWKVFKKLGKPGWAAIVPFYNVYVLCCEIAEKKWWYILLLCVPIANIYAMYVIYDAVAKKFGKDTGYTIGMIFLPIIFFPMLAFSKNANPVQEDTHENETQSTQNMDMGNTTMNDSNTLQNNAVQNVDLEKTSISIGGPDGIINDFTNGTGMGAAPVMPVQNNTVINDGSNVLNGMSEIKSEPLSYGSTFNGDATKVNVEMQENIANMAGADGLYQAPTFDNNTEQTVSLNSSFDNTPDYSSNLQNNYNNPVNDLNLNDGLGGMANRSFQENTLNNTVNNAVETLNNKEVMQGFNEQVQNNYTSTVNNQNSSEELNSQNNINSNVTLGQNDNVNAPVEKANNNDLNGGHTSLWSNNNQNNTQI